MTDVSQQSQFFDFMWSHPSNEVKNLTSVLDGCCAESPAKQSQTFDFARIMPERTTRVLCWNKNQTDSRQEVITLRELENNCGEGAINTLKMSLQHLHCV